MAKSFGRTYVLLRPLALRDARRTDPLQAFKPQYVQGYEVQENVGEYGGIILDEVTMTDHPNYPVNGPDGKKEYVSRKVLRVETQWMPTSCTNCGVALDADYIDVETDKPKVRVCKECHRAIEWTSRKLYVCEPVRWDVDRLLGSLSTEPPWTWVEVRSAEQLAIYTGGAPEEAEWDDVEGDDTADEIEARALEGAAEVRSNVPNEYRELQRKVDILMANGAPKELSHGKTSPMEELRAYVDKYNVGYGNKWTGQVPAAS